MLPVTDSPICVTVELVPARYNYTESCISLFFTVQYISVCMQ